MNDKTYAQIKAAQYQDPSNWPDGYRLTVDIVSERNINDASVLKLERPMEITISKKDQLWVDDVRSKYYQRQVDARHIKK